MRTAKYGSDEYREFARKLEENNGDTKGTPYEICDNSIVYDCLESVDELLKPHGLQVVMIDDKSSEYVFKIENVSDSDLHPVRFTNEQMGLIKHIMNEFCDYFEEESEEFFKHIEEAEKEGGSHDSA